MNGLVQHNVARNVQKQSTGPSRSVQCTEAVDIGIDQFVQVFFDQLAMFVGKLSKVAKDHAFVDPFLIERLYDRAHSCFEIHTPGKLNTRGEHVRRVTGRFAAHREFFQLEHADVGSHPLFVFV